MSTLLLPNPIKETKEDILIQQLKAQGFPTWKAFDFFAAAGGTTHGFNDSHIINVVAALNHDAEAIACHKLNNQFTEHFIEDIRKQDLLQLKKYRNLIDLLWASVECTSFSKAKGGTSRDADSMALAEEVTRYAKYLNPKYIMIENVEEFLLWGPVIPKLNKDGSLCLDKKTGEIIYVLDPERMGEYYHKWIRDMKDIGYKNYEFRLLKACDYGAATTRLRYFGIFTRDDFPICWPEPTHNEFGTDGCKKWVSCSQFIDTNDIGQSIFDRENNMNLLKQHRKPLAENTLNRIAYGIKKYALPEHFLIKYYGNSNGLTMDEPLHTITKKDRFAKIYVEKSQFITQHMHGSNNYSGIDKPMNTLIKKDEKYLVTLEKQNEEIIKQFLIKNYSGNHALSLKGPIHTITKIDHHALVSVKIQGEKRQFIDKYLSGKYNVQGIDEPMSTITKVAKKTLITADVLDDAIINIYYRILNADELKLCQGFSKEYILTGSQATQKKFIGNSVSPFMSKALGQTNYLGYIRHIGRLN